MNGNIIICATVVFILFRIRHAMKKVKSCDKLDEIEIRTCTIAEMQKWLDTCDNLMLFQEDDCRTISTDITSETIDEEDDDNKLLKI